MLNWACNPSSRQKLVSHSIITWWIEYHGACYVGAHLLVAGWVEAFFTVVIYRFVNKLLLQSCTHQVQSIQLHLLKKIRWVLLALIVLSPLGLLADGTAFGEWSTEELVACFMAKSQQGSKWILF